MNARNRRKETIAQEAAEADNALRAIAEGRDPNAAPDPAVPEGEANQEAPITGDNKIDPHSGPRNPSPRTAVEGEAPAEATATPERSQAAAVDAAHVAKMEQRLRTLEGMYNASQADLQQTRGQLTAVQNLIAKRETLPEARAEKPETAPVGKDYQPFTDAERKEWDDVLGLVERAVGLSLHAPLQAVVGRIVKLEQQLNNVHGQARQVQEQVQQQKNMTIQERLLALVPDLEEINVNPEFLDWLNKPAKFSSRPKIDDLRAFHEAGDVNRVAEFFNAWKEETGRTPAVANTPAAEPSRTNNDIARSLVAPHPAASGRPASQPGPRGRTFKQAEVDKLYDDYAKKRISRAEFQKQEAEISLAATEGRLLG